MNKMMRKCILLLCLMLVAINGFSQSLVVKPGSAVIQQEDGTPFLWLGDTAWELFHRLNGERVYGHPGRAGV